MAEHRRSAAGRAVVTAGSARSLLLTILGELVMPDSDTVRTSALLHVLTGIGVEEQTARQAIARGASAGWIAGHRRGREVEWALTEPGRRLLDEGARRIEAMTVPAEPWDGDWLMVLVSIPQSQSAVRKRLYGTLGWEGFGNPTPGVWLSPDSGHRDRVRRVIDELDLHRSTLTFVGRPSDIGLSTEDIVRQAWDLDEVKAEYEQFLVRFSGWQPGAGDPVLFAYVQMVSDWRRFPDLDPRLPQALLPDWIGRRAAVVFTELRSDWRARARQRWQEVATAASRSGALPS